MALWHKNNRNDVKSPFATVFIKYVISVGNFQPYMSLTDDGSADVASGSNVDLSQSDVTSY